MCCCLLLAASWPLLHLLHMILQDAPVCCLANLVKQCSDGTWHNTRVCWRAHHGVRFAAAGDSICKHSAADALHHWLNSRPPHMLKHLQEAVQHNQHYSKLRQLLVMHAGTLLLFDCAVVRPGLSCKLNEVGACNNKNSSFMLHSLLQDVLLYTVLTLLRLDVRARASRLQLSCKQLH
jgi:hypothetical protein